MKPKCISSILVTFMTLFKKIFFDYHYKINFDSNFCYIFLTAIKLFHDYINLKIKKVPEVFT
ncbi:hypothetical protein BpHYR1_037576 [Brachionus plicatilis]|uniref:Uncharacterized protein n=1 Tax=Brachionus plicatilis TaxID=10195 RepID=A0A3M7PDY7_BRAPC|nr:hypothetical protein BpHYR1_037576 [Brachionus plicatilis]